MKSHKKFIENYLYITKDGKPESIHAPVEAVKDLLDLVAEQAFEASKAKIYLGGGILNDDFETFQEYLNYINDE